MKVAVTGATGFVGKALTERLKRLDREVLVLSRRPNLAVGAPSSVVTWNALDPARSGLTAALRDVSAVVNLAGEPVAAQRWTPAVKARIRDSRVLGTRALVEAMAALPAEERPGVLVSASAIGYYGERGDEILTEKSASGAGFLADVCGEWEHEALRAKELGIRVVVARLGIVLGSGGGALSKMPPVVIGDGQSWMSWIQLKDAVRVLVHALGDEAVEGVLNVAAPCPVRQKDFVRCLVRARGWPALHPAVPKVVLAAVLGERSAALLSSCRAVPERLLKGKFKFSYPSLDAALAEAR